MVRRPDGSIMENFQDLEDPRIEHGSGADSWGYVEMFGKSKEEWFRNFLLVRKIAFSCSRKSNQSPDALAPALHRFNVDHP